MTVYLDKEKERLNLIQTIPNLNKFTAKGPEFATPGRYFVEIVVSNSH